MRSYINSHANLNHAIAHRMAESSFRYLPSDRRRAKVKEIMILTFGTSPQRSIPPHATTYTA